VKPNREFLGHDHSSVGRRKVFLLVDALETDELLFIRIERTRVYFDDVLAITYHRERGVLFLLFSGVLSFIWALPAIGFFVKGESDSLAAGTSFAILAGLFGLAFLLRATLQVEVISVFGRRTNSRMKFWFRKERARQIYATLIDQVRAWQERASAAAAPPPAPAVPEALSPPPPLPAEVPPPAPAAPPEDKTGAP
jgi:hypothetical protein